MAAVPVDTAVLLDLAMRPQYAHPIQTPGQSLEVDTHTTATQHRASLNRTACQTTNKVLLCIDPQNHGYQDNPSC